MWAGHWPLATGHFPLLPMPDFRPVATFLAADLAPAFSALFGTQKTLRTGNKGLIAKKTRIIGNTR